RERPDLFTQSGQTTRKNHPAASVGLDGAPPDAHDRAVDVRAPEGTRVGKRPRLVLGAIGGVAIGLALLLPPRLAGPDLCLPPGCPAPIGLSLPARAGGTTGGQEAVILLG